MTMLHFVCPNCGHHVGADTDDPYDGVTLWCLACDRQMRESEEPVVLPR